MFSKLNMFKRFFIVAILLMSTSCEDHDHDNHDHGETHMDADGFKLENSDGDEVYRQFDGSVTTPDGGTSITLEVGAELELTVHFLDDEEEEIDHAEEEGEEEDLLVVEIPEDVDTDVATVEAETYDHSNVDCENISQSSCNTTDGCHLMSGSCMSDADMGHAEDHEFGVHIHAESAGTTEFIIKLMHGTHVDFTSLPILVTVE